MPSFGTINNGESGLSVRTKLNNVINYVNTGITSGSSFTYITEDTTSGSEELLIEVSDDTYTSRVETYPNYVNTNSTDGTSFSFIYTSPVGMELQSNNGTTDRTSLNLGDTLVNLFASNEVDTGRFRLEKDYSKNEVEVLLFEGTTNAYSATTGQNKGVITFIIPTDDAVTYFNTGNTIVVYYQTLGVLPEKYYLDKVVTSVTTTSPSISFPNGRTLVRIDNNIPFIPSEYYQETAYIYTPNLGGAGTFTIPEYIKITKLELDPLVSVNGTNFGVTDGISTSRYNVSEGYVTQYSLNNLGYNSSIEMEPSYISLSNGDGNYGSSMVMNISTINLSCGVGDITDTFVISPDSNIDNTKLRSEDTNTGQYSQITIVCDNPAWDCGDSGTNLSSLTFTPNNPSFSSTDGNWTSALELDPTEGGNFTNLSTSDGTHNNRLQVSQGDVSLTSISGASQTSIILTPTIINYVGVTAYDDDTDAGTSGLVTGDLYQTTGLGASPLNVAGILMIKQ